ncbi:hypothetical protein ACFE04_005274 [Oxalis oulophora]
MIPLVILALFILNGCCGSSWAAFTPVDNYLIACGASKNVTFQGRTFVPDSHQSSPSLKSGNSVVLNANSSNFIPPIYQSARVFSGVASYKFNIQQQGRHWIRLYFYPVPNSANNLNSAPITVLTDKFVLLHNFTFNNYNGSYMFKEYAVNVTSSDLTLTFIPLNNSVVFVNGIEVVSIPDSVFPDIAFTLNPLSTITGLSELAYETVYRLNMGGPLITAQNDTLGRIWVNDEKYLHLNSSALEVSVPPATIDYKSAITPEVAPNWVYATAETMGEYANVPDVNFNVTWVFKVDPNFRYFVRAHFCDIMSNALNTLVFNVYVNDDIAIVSLDLSSLTGGLNVPYYRDFVTNASVDSNDTLTVSIGPDSMADITNATLNGLEVMKISNDAKSLDGLSSVMSIFPRSSSNRNKMGIMIGLVIGILAMLALFGFCYCCVIANKSKSPPQRHSWLPLPLYGNSQTMTKMSTTSQKSGTTSCISLVSSNLGRLFSFQEIMDATNKFDETLLLGVGGFDLPSLSWNQRLEICIGAARGLHYLHTGAAQSIIHRDVKTTNILLDENYVAKVADFGLSKAGPAIDQTHVSTAVKGSFGYLDPEYFRRQQLTEKSDVYSFGVVLMEVLCTRPALNPVLPREQVNIAEWAMTWQKKGMLDHIMDPNLSGKVNIASLKKFGETAEKCLAEHGVERPSMGDVLWNLEYALQLEETSSALNLMEPDDNSTNHIQGIPLTPFENSVNMIDVGHSGTDDDGEDAATSAVFSQLVNPRGR